MRFLGRPLVRRGANWDALARVMPASKQAEFNATVAAFNKRKEKAASAQESAPIDFDSYKEILGAKEVDAIRKEYEAFSYTDFEAEKNAELAELQSALAETVAAIDEQSANLSAAAAQASEELAELERTRTTLETSIDDVMRRNPEVVAELEQRLANEDWDTESKPIDVNALRLEAIEKNWDSSTLGALDEDTQKAFIEEIEALEASNASNDIQEEMPEHLQKYINEWHDLLGRTPDLASARAFAAANQVTDADRAVTNERELWTAIDAATELGQFERAHGLIEHAKALRASGDIVEDPAWRESEVAKLTTARSHQDYNTPVSEEEIAGLSAAELESLADEAADNSDFYRASHLIYAARVASGDVNPNESNLETLSGIANHFIKSSKAMAQ